jgi:hypothetical protein
MQEKLQWDRIDLELQNMFASINNSLLAMNLTFIEETLTRLRS